MLCFLSVGANSQIIKKLRVVCIRDKLIGNKLFTDLYQFLIRWGYQFENHGFIKFTLLLRTSVPETFHFRFVFCLLIVVMVTRRLRNENDFTLQNEMTFITL